MGSIGSIWNPAVQYGKCFRVERSGKSNCKPPQPCAAPMNKAFEVCYDNTGKIVSETEIDMFKPYNPRTTDQALSQKASIDTNNNLILGLIAVVAVILILK